MILVDFCRFSVFFEHFWSILIPGGFVRPRKNSRHTNSARRIETGRLEALEIPQIPRKIDFELVFWAGPGPGPGPGRARAKHVLLAYDINKKDAQRPYDPFAGGIAPRSLLCVRKRRFLFLTVGPSHVP